MIHIDWRVPPLDDNGFATPVALPKADVWITTRDGHLYRGEERFMVFGAATNEACCALDDSAERIGVPKRVAAHGYNVVRFLGLDTKVSPHGVWTSSAPYGYPLSEEYLARMDEMIAHYNSRGIYVWLGVGNHYGRQSSAAGLPIAHSAGSNALENAGLMWHSEWLQSYKEYVRQLLERPNSITGIKYADNPGIMCWQFFNENGMLDVFRREGSLLDGIVNGAGGSSGPGFYKAELDAKLALFASSRGWTVPSIEFPTRADYDEWDVADKEFLHEFIANCEIQAAQDCKAWLKSFNRKLLFCYGETNYSDIRVAAVSDIASMHAYSQVAAGSAIGNPPNYKPRKSILTDPNGWQWSVNTAMRHPAVPFVITERGNYGLTKWDFEDSYLEAIVQCLQDSDGFITFVEGQGADQSGITGIVSLTHVMAGWPSRKLAALAVAPLLRHRFIGPLTNTNTYTLDPIGISSNAVANGLMTMTGFRYIPFGVEWSWLRNRVSTRFGTPQSVVADTTYDDGDIASGIAIASGTGRNAGTTTWQGVSGTPLVTLNFPSVQGWVGSVPGVASKGSIAISGASGYIGVCFLRSSGDWPLYEGEALLFMHQCSYVDAQNFDPSEAGDDEQIVTSHGTPANTRLIVPDAFEVVLASGRPLAITGVNDDGTETAIPCSYDAVEETVSFETDTDVPLYRIVPLPIASRTLSRGGSRR